MQLYGDAIESFSQATGLAPSDPMAYSGLANACYAAGRLEDAVAACNKLLELQPGNPDHWYLLATIYGLMENHEEAAPCLRRVTELSPTHAQAHRSLGCLLQAQGRLDEALDSFRRAVECRPDFVDAQNDIGVVLQAQGHDREAIDQYQTVLRLEPGFVYAMINLGNLLLSQNRAEEAQGYFESVLAIDSVNMNALSGLGSALLALGETGRAHDCFSRALSLDPASEEVKVKMARLHEREGNYEQALSLLRPLVDGDVGADAAAVFALLSPRVHEEGRAIALLETVLGKGGLTRAQQMEIYFSLGRLYDKKGEYNSAFRNFEQGNALKQAEFRMQGHVNLIDALIGTYSRDNLPRLAKGSSSERQPLFIVGMPRSGTSLIEQILSVHPEVQAAGELETLNRIAAQMHETTSANRPYPPGAMFLASENLGDLASVYLDDLPAEGRGKAFFTDKMPHNFLHLGFIQQIFPNARIIHCERDARDTCLSCYTYDFIGVHPYAYDLKTLGEYYLQYRRIMAHWKSVLDIPIYNLQYEKLISDQEQEVRCLLEFCGLEWDERCLDFHSSGRAVRTASYDQVRRPIYTSSVGRWRHYKEHIQPLLDVLQLAE